ncbi:MAG TPA: GatB/YqeY domain-containing protein [Methylomirabilota bacterium]|nr:GatB/YqeY domain-containing protein [Methylomirabilota bacterium]
MSLLARIQDELKAAMLARDHVRLSTLRLLKSAIGYVQIEKKNENLPDAEVVAIIQREIKKRRDAAEQFEAGGRAEQAASERAEIAVLEGFLPRPLSAEELEQLVRSVIAETGAVSKKEMGVVMKAAQAKAAGRADGRAISAVVSRLLP